MGGEASQHSTGMLGASGTSGKYSRDLGQWHRSSGEQSDSVQAEFTRNALRPG